MPNKKEITLAVNKTNEKDLMYFQIDWINAKEADSAMRKLNQLLKQNSFSVILLKK
jgi:hypothetical protein